MTMIHNTISPIYIYMYISLSLYIYIYIGIYTYIYIYIYIYMKEVHTPITLHVVGWLHPSSCQ